MSEEKVLTKEIAEQFLKSGTYEEYYTKIEDDAAEVLSHENSKPRSTLARRTDCNLFPKENLNHPHYK